jgi:hypothetical protein
MFQGLSIYNPAGSRESRISSTGENSQSGFSYRAVEFHFPIQNQDPKVASKSTAAKLPRCGTRVGLAILLRPSF